MNIIYTKLIELIGLNEGIVWGERSCHDSHFRLQFYIHNSKTRLLAHYVAEASNTPLNVYAKRPLGELDCENNFDSELVHEYRSGLDDDTLDKACWLGSHFTWAMYKTGIISSKMEQEFCGVFGAVSRNA
ncbi:hypothetical protein ACJJIW_20815 [Microbulbifer sp. JMSA004]|uniref:hypothetical protein n=1 Tax=unclassified Microbulbifer TaxID=2619833 RepID=UPI0024ADCCD0|nr:hypothetical protein [Microbulbifer sp. VAAF005]WHI46427.1 hypothetical protein P0078_22400 [Microbulbifer sp. VAAF005]